MIEMKLRQLNDGTTTREPAKIGADRIEQSGTVNWSCADSSEKELSREDVVNTAVCKSVPTDPIVS